MLREIIEGESKGIRWRLTTVDNVRSLDDMRTNEAAQPVPSLKQILGHRLLAGREVLLLMIQVDGLSPVYWPLAIEQRTIRGVGLKLLVTAGDDFFDYLPLPVPSGVSFHQLKPILAAIPKILSVDGVLLAHCLFPLPEGADYWCQRFSNRCFKAPLASNGWGFLTRKESLRRHRNRARKSFSYRVTHISGQLAPDLIAVIASLHRERWAFDDVESAFDVPGRIGSYAACGDSLFTTLVYDGTVMLAAHVGMCFGDTLIWHTPVINLRYLTFSPLEILLLETAEECERRALACIDYGLGDESYKQRFSNSGRAAANLYLPSTLKAWFAQMLSKISWLAGARKRIALAGRSQRDSREKTALTLFPPAVIQSGDVAEAHEVITDFGRLVDVFRDRAWPLRRRHYERLRRGERFYFVEAGESSGVWIRGADAENPPATGALQTGYDPVGSDRAVSGMLRQLPVANRIILTPERGPLILALRTAGWR